MAYQNLHQFISAGEWSQLTTAFAAMSHMEFRRASAYVRTNVLPTLANDALWEALLHLVQYRRQAFLSGVLSLERLAAADGLDFQSVAARRFADYLCREHPASVLKVVNMILPFLQTRQQADALFNAFRVDDKQQQIKALLKVESPLAYYLLFVTLCHLTDRRQLALDCCRYIMHRDNDMAYNMVAILKAYFGLNELHGQFSLQIAPYELSLLDRGEQTFYHLLNGKRPQL